MVLPVVIACGIVLSGATGYVTFQVGKTLALPSGSVEQAPPKTVLGITVGGGVAIAMYRAQRQILDRHFAHLLSFTVPTKMEQWGYRDFLRVTTPYIGTRVAMISTSLALMGFITTKLDSRNHKSSGVSSSQSLVLSDHNQPESLNDSLHEDEWTLEARESLWHHIQNTVPDTVPNNVECIKVKRCDKRNVCAIVCQSGSVVVDPWLQQALKLQRKLAFHRDFCHAHVPGSHNSAINIADGYGIEDHIFEGYLQYLSWFKKGMQVHTNDQLFSVTDQLNMGVRFIEVDVHWFDNDLRIAHCGGFHSNLLDELVSVLNKVAKWLGTDIEWDSSTIGCKPSLSSIPASEQRHLNETLKEIATWLHSPENHEEFIMVFFDDQSNLFRWKKVSTLLQYLSTHFDEHEIFVPDDLIASKGWPNFNSLIQAGKRVIFMSGSNYSPQGDKLLFVKDNICDWTEPDLPFTPFPDCQFPKVHEGPLDHDHTIFRPETSEIVYAFLNADGHRGGNDYLLNETSIPPLMQCGVNIPSPDNITPERMESTIWVLSRPTTLIPGKCVGLSRASLTWISVDCNTPGYVSTCMESGNYQQWKIGMKFVKEEDANASCNEIEKSWVYASPTNGYENKLLYEMLQNAPSNVKGIWINAKSIVADVFSIPSNEATHSSPFDDMHHIVSLE